MKLELDPYSPLAVTVCPRCGFESTHGPVCTLEEGDVELMLEPSSWAVRMRWGLARGLLSINQAREMVSHEEWLPEHIHARLDALGVPRDVDAASADERAAQRLQRQHGAHPPLLTRLRQRLRTGRR